MATTAGNDEWVPITGRLLWLGLGMGAATGLVVVGGLGLVALNDDPPVETGLMIMMMVAAGIVGAVVGLISAAGAAITYDAVRRRAGPDLAIGMATATAAVVAGVVWYVAIRPLDGAGQPLWVTGAAALVAAGLAASALVRVAGRTVRA